MSSVVTPQSSVPAKRTEAIDWLRVFSLVSIVIGLCISGYLSYIKFTNEPMVCVENGPFNCSVVQASNYSMLFGVPIAYFGFATYVVLGILLLFESRLAGAVSGNIIMVEFGIGLFAWLFSMWLVFVQFSILGALCTWCLAHEANFTVLFAMISLRTWRTLYQD